MIFMLEIGIMIKFKEKDFINLMMVNILNGNFNNEDWILLIQMMKNSNFDNIEFFLYSLKLKI